MAADITRPKNDLIQRATSDFQKNVGEIEYIAHLVLSRNRAFPIGKATQSSGSGASNHPDQVFWNKQAKALKDVLAKAEAIDAEILRVEIDCTLMPCEGTNGCTTTVPALMKGLGYTGLKVRVFSHRDERGAKEQNRGEKPSRYFDFVVGDRTNALEDARGDTGGWAWEK